jgi:MFS family permease
MQRIIQIYREAFFGLPKLAWTLALALFINRSGSMVLFFLTIYLTSQLHFSVSTAGAMISIYGLGSLLGAFTGGWLSDIFRPRKIQIYSLLFSGLLYILLGYIHSPVLFAFLLFLLSASADAFRPANSTAMADACPPEIRVRGFALNRLAINLGVAIGPAIGGWLATINYLYLFWIDGLTSLLAIGVLLYPAPRTGHQDSLVHKNLVSMPKSPWRDVIFLTVLSLAFLLGLVFVQLFNTWPLYLRSAYHLLENKIGLLLALNALMIVVIEMPLVFRLEKKNPVKIMFLGSIFFLSGFIILPLGSSFSYALVTVFIFTWGEMLVFPLMIGFIANRAPDQIRGRYMGLYTFTFSLCYVLAPLLGTWIYENYGSDRLWFSMSCLTLPMVAGFLFLQHRIQTENRYPDNSTGF